MSSLVKYIVVLMVPFVVRKLRNQKVDGTTGFVANSVELVIGNSTNGAGGDMRENSKAEEISKHTIT